MTSRGRSIETDVRLVRIDIAIIFFRLDVGKSKEINLEKQSTLSKLLSWYMCLRLLR